MNNEELIKVLEQHKLWLETRYTNDVKGSRADLSRVNLRGADLRCANLRGADLSSADLRGANLRGADLDFSALPLWCGSLTANMDDKQVVQLLYHILSIVKHSSNVSHDLKSQLLTDQNLEMANLFHRVYECRRL